jgi:hypothetical protein
MWRQKTPHHKHLNSAALYAYVVGFFSFNERITNMNFPLTTKLSGVSHGDCQDNIKQFGCPDTGFYILIREPDNPYDPNAIAVSLGGIWHMGYVPSGFAAELAPLIDAGKIFEAEFVRRNEYPPHELVGLTVRILNKNII